MKRKTINAVICKKFDHFLNTAFQGNDHETQRVKELVRKNTVITGGCIASMLLNEKVNDFDLYFRDKETTLAVANYFVGWFKRENKNSIVPEVREEGDRVSIMIKSSGTASEEGDSGYQYFEGTTDYTDTENFVDGITDILDNNSSLENPSYRPVFMTENAITCKNDIQLVLRFYGDPEKIHENYDFVHCTNYWDSKERKVVLKPDAMEALLTKELRYIGSKYPIASLVRSRKFINRGFSITAGQYLKMAMQISKLDLENVSVLRENLMGVDVAYFYEILSVLKEKQENGEKTIDHTYLMEIIDRIT